GRLPLPTQFRRRRNLVGKGLPGGSLHNSCLAKVLWIPSQFGTSSAKQVTAAGAGGVGGRRPLAPARGAARGKGPTAEYPPCAETKRTTDPGGATRTKKPGRRGGAEAKAEGAVPLNARVSTRRTTGTRPNPTRLRTWASPPPPPTTPSGCTCGRW